MKTDSLFYRLFQTSPALLFELTGQPNPFAETYTFRSVEVKQTSFRIDGVFLPEPLIPETPVYFAEVQFQLDRQIYARLANEVVMFLNQNPSVESWGVVIIYGDRRCRPRTAGAYTSLLTLPQVQELFLDELAAQEPESVELGLVRLIVEPEQTAIERAQQLVDQAKNATSRLSTPAIIEMIETIVIYKFPQMTWQEVEAMFGLSELKQTRVYQQGLEQGQRSLILRQLARRLGSIPEPIQAHLNALSLTDLEILGEALLDFSSLEDLQQWLDAQ